MKITKEMQDHFSKRTNLHINLVKKWYEKIYRYYKNTLYKDGTLSRIYIDDHDSSKFKVPEYIPYVYLTWEYYCKDNNITFEIDDEMRTAINQAVIQHMTTNLHHPEYWDDYCRGDKTIPVDAKTMPLSYIVEMCADWLAMSEEKGNGVIEWADKTINKRWMFTKEQVDFIYETLNKVSKRSRLWSR